MDAEDRYAFLHPLTRDAAYQMQLPSVRAERHRGVARVMTSEAAYDTVAGALDAVAHMRTAGADVALAANPAFLEEELATLRNAMAVLAREVFPGPSWRPVTERLAEHPLAVLDERMLALKAIGAAAANASDRAGFASAVRRTLAHVDTCEEPDRARWRADIRAWMLRVKSTEPGIVAEEIDAEEVIAAARASGNAAAAVVAEVSAAAIANRAGNLSLGTSLAKRALVSAQRAGLHIEEAEAHFAVGHGAAYRGDFAEAKASFLRGLTAIERTTVNRRTGSLRVQLATQCSLSMSMLGEFDEAVVHARRAHQFAARTGDRGVLPRTSSTLAFALDAAGRLVAARDAYFLSLAQSREAGGLRDEPLTLGNLAALLQRLGEFRGAIRFADAALQVTAHRHDPRYHALIRSDLARTRLLAGDTFGAREDAAAVAASPHLAASPERGWTSLATQVAVACATGDAAAAVALAAEIASSARGFPNVDSERAARETGRVAAELAAAHKAGRPPLAVRGHLACDMRPELRLRLLSDRAASTPAARRSLMSGTQGMPVPEARA